MLDETKVIVVSMKVSFMNFFIFYAKEVILNFNKVVPSTQVLKLSNAARLAQFLLLCLSVRLPES